jgi:hypothetical protein
MPDGMRDRPRTSSPTFSRPIEETGPGYGLAPDKKSNEIKSAEKKRRLGPMNVVTVSSIYGITCDADRFIPKGATD